MGSVVRQEPDFEGGAEEVVGFAFADAEEGALGLQVPGLLGAVRHVRVGGAVGGGRGCLLARLLSRGGLGLAAFARLAVWAEGFDGVAGEVVAVEGVGVLTVARGAGEDAQDVVGAHV